MIRFAFLVACLFSTTSLLAQDMPLTQVLIPGEDWELLSEGHKFTEAPAVDDAGNVYFADVPTSQIFKIDTNGKRTIFTEDSQRTSGLMFGPGGMLYGCQNGAKRIVKYDGKGKATIIVENIPCNDLVVNSRGEVYFTDPVGQQVWFVSSAGKAKVVAKGFKPNGIILWSNEGTLIVTDGDAPHLRTFRVLNDGTLDAGELYYGPLQMPPGAERPGSDGMTVDNKGRLYVASYSGLQMFDPTGRLGGAIAKPQQKFLSNVVFGGPELQYLYVTCADKVYRRKVKPQGVPFRAAKLNP